MSERLYCDEPDCERPVAGHGSDKCSTHRRQLTRTGKCVPIAVKLSPEERAVEAGIAYLEAETDEEFATRKRAWVLAMRAMTRKDAAGGHALEHVVEQLRRHRSEAVKKGLLAAQARGVRLGRPPRVSDEEIHRLFAWLKSGAAVAKALNMHQATVNQRLAKAFGKRRISRMETSPRSDG